MTFYDEYGTFNMGNGRKAREVRLKFTKGRVSPTAAGVHIFVAAWADWYPGVPESFRLRYSTACAGRQTYSPVPVSDRSKVTCRRCIKKSTKGRT